MNPPIYSLAALGALALAGCAPQPPQPTSPTDSPVSPAAMESPMPQIETLALSSSPDDHAAPSAPRWTLTRPPLLSRQRQHSTPVR